MRRVHGRRGMGELGRPSARPGAWYLRRAGRRRASSQPLAFRSGRATLRGRGSEVKSAQREWLQLKFKGTFHEKRGAAFQDWFADLMSARHPGDFQRIRAYGSLGDRKCDGFLRTTGTYSSVTPRVR